MVRSSTGFRYVHDFLAAATSRVPEKLALICGSRRLTYAEIDDCANRLANALRHHGIQRGDRIILCLSNRVEVVVGIFAVLKAGATFVVVHHSTKEDKLAYIAHNCAAVALLLDGRAAWCSLGGAFLESVLSLKLIVTCGKTIAGALDAKRRWLDMDALLHDYPSTPPAPAHPDPELACLVYTSGTTGEPKGVMCDHANIVFAASSISQYLASDEADIVLSVLPLSFTYGLYQLYTTFMVGGTLVLENSFAYPATILSLMERERVTGFPGVPTMYSMLLRQDLSTYKLPALRYLTNAAAALSSNQALEVQRRFPQAQFFSMYGQTETGRALYLPPHLLVRKPDSVGIAIPGTEAWIEDESGTRLGPGLVGELVVRGPHVMRGYWGDEDATAAKFRPDASREGRIFRTGDLFRADDEGCFYFVSRQDDIIKTRGEKVAPKEVESVLYRLKGVVSAVVLGVSDPMLGQAIKAVIVSDTPLSASTVQSHCRAHLEEFMVPQHVEFRDSLPLTVTGKIKKNELV